MICPICHKNMSKVRSDTSHNPANQKKYARTIYHCDKDDTWITVEYPNLNP